MGQVQSIQQIIIEKAAGIEHSKGPLSGNWTLADLKSGTDFIHLGRRPLSFVNALYELRAGHCQLLHLHPLGGRPEN